MRPKQQTLAAGGFERYCKRTRREQFLADMNRVVSWGPLTELIAPSPAGAGVPHTEVGVSDVAK